VSNNVAGIIQLGSCLNLLKGGDRNFAESLVTFYQQKGRLSEKQQSFIPKLLEKAEAATKPKPTTQIENFEKIIEVFDVAKKAEHKKPKLRLGDLDYKIVLSPAPDSGMNAGMIYVKVNDEYKGKISRDGAWQVSGPQDEILLQKLGEFSLAPQEPARKFGFKTGTCCVCGRKLTDKISIANGIGPICAEGWGL
jgi:hypothetical protein